MTNKILEDKGILPVSEQRWRVCHISLRPDSSKDEIKQAKSKINELTQQVKGGVYVIKKYENILYIGESKKDIRRRLIRHLEKIYKRENDKRADFFKQINGYGELVIEILPLNESEIDFRKDIEKALTFFLKPVYLQWEADRQTNRLEKFNFLQSSEKI